MPHILRHGTAVKFALGAWDAFCNIFMLTGWGLHATPILGVSWSVSAELFCYIFFPLIALLAAQHTVMLGFVAFAAFAAIAWMAHLGLGVEGPMDIVSADVSFSLARALCGFTLGVIGYSLSERAGSVRLQMANYLLPLALLGLCASWFSDTSDLVTYVAIAFVVWLIAQDSKVGERLFGNGPVYILGQISYSLYLIPSTPGSIFAKLTWRLSPMLGFEARFALMLSARLGLAIVLSYGSWIVFEKWGQRAMLRILSFERRAAV